MEPIRVKTQWLAHEATMNKSLCTGQNSVERDTGATRLGNTVGSDHGDLQSATGLAFVRAFRRCGARFGRDSFNGRHWSFASSRSAG